MRLFIDTGSVSEVEEIARWGVLSGATTNPSLLAKEEGEPEEILRHICELVNGPVSAEVVSEDADHMVEEGYALRDLHEHITVKVPFNDQGLIATRRLTDDGIPVNMTLVFSPTQALLAAAAGATYVSCFMGRLDDISVDSTSVVGQIADTLHRGGMTSEIIAASIRNPGHIVQAAHLGCEIATTPAKVLKQMLEHPLTTSGAKKFRDDWETRPEFGDWLRGLTEQRAAAR